VVQVVVVLDDLFVTSGAVGVMEGRQFALSDALCRPNHRLECLAVEGGEVAYQALIQPNRMLCLSVWVDRNCPFDVDRGCSLCCFLKYTIISFVLLTSSERLFS
jgi:radical SAM superfamily enzyme with C-terminal helix-hairpin-helix motif